MHLLGSFADDLQAAVAFATQRLIRSERFLRDGLLKHGCRLYAFVLMTNHVHLLALGATPGAISGLMQSLGRRYAPYVNMTYRRTGTLFEGRFKSSLVDSERYLLTCMRYIEFNPVRAGLVTDPGEYRWSSYRSHVSDAALNWLAEPAEYRRLGANSDARALAYRELFKQPLAAYDLEAIRAHLNKDCALGSSRFQAEIEAMAGRRARIVPQGWSRKPRDGTEK